MITYKVAILGQDTYENVSKIKKHIFNWRDNFYDKLQIVSGGGKYGVEKNVKEICLEFGIKYTEIPPFHYKWNQYCYLPMFKYNKKYNVKHFFVQDKLIVDYVDVIIFFTNDENITEAETLKKLVEKQKKLLIFKS